MIQTPKTIALSLIVGAILGSASTLAYVKTDVPAAPLVGDRGVCAAAVEAVIRYSEKRDADLAYHGAPKTQAHWEKWNRVKANEIRGRFERCLAAEAAAAVDPAEAAAAEADPALAAALAAFDASQD
ncbi:MAG: hypothetical protein EOM24_37260 [Chloroflexia bacterium]|nr:hypothetical protein [Chloroflexia bacterium]